jgi:hypothetical protein
MPYSSLKKLKEAYMSSDASRLRREDKPSYWQAQVSSWRRSGLSQAQFCRDHNLKVRDFGYWKRKFSRSSGSARFVPLRVRSTPSPSSSLGLVLESGLRIEVREGFSPGTLRDLIHTLREL